MSRDALVVGINHYQHLSRLKAPGTDAEAIAQRLEQDGEFRVWRLPEIVADGKPQVGQQTAVSLAALKTALVKLFKPDSDQFPDTALFYFSGHGLREDLGISEGYLATSDVSPSHNFYGLSLRWLRRLLEESPVRQQIIWLDCCHSGELLNFGEADPGDRGKGRDRCFIAASREYEPAYEDLTSDHSVLTQALLAGLDPRQFSDRWVTNLSLTDFINQTLKQEIQTPICNNSGEPINLTRQWTETAETTTATSAQDICPYKGLSYFDFNNDDYKYFYGRRALTDELLDKVRQSNFLAIVGASGSGKSSVLRAGLLHQLQVGRRIFGSDGWDIRILRPDSRPCQSLAAAFIDNDLPRIERAEQQGKAEALINEGADGLRRLVQTSEGDRVILVIDQFEEVFTLCQDTAEREQFFATLLGALETTDKLCLILAMRADFVGKCFEQSYSGLAEQVQNNLVAVKPMTREELSEAILKPAAQVGLTLEPELVNTLLNDVERSPGSLPLLQYTLTQLWEKRQDNRLHLNTYVRLGGVTGTLKQRADEVYQGFSEEKQLTTKHIFLNLTQLGEGAEDTRRRVTQQSLITAQHPAPLIDEVIKCLADANLVVTSQLISKSDGSRVAIVDVAHEALIRNWPLLRKWLDENRDLLRQQRKIELAAQEWKEQGQPKGYLFQGRQLSDAQGFRKKQVQDLPLSALADSFIRKSLWQRRLTLAMLSSFLLVPLIAVESYLRERAVKEDYSRLYSDSPAEVRQAVLTLVEGCNEISHWSNWSKRTGEKLFGNCRTLASQKSLTKAQLQNADLSSADLRDAVLRDADLSSANLRDAYLSSADLSSADLSSANLRDANLRDAYLSSAYLSSADLSSADLRDAVLRFAVLRDADLSSANLRDANLSYSILLNTDFRGAKNLTSEQLEGENPPLLCNAALPPELTAYKDRDCEKLPQVLVDRGGWFESVDEAEAFVEEERLREWE
ncbi:pentapeptide repeat-containing protein [Sphaerothrix gracilis]|uniref:nSTAND1 domain-containing NTPase n=1 Tax=Sphaerothrix gracilis TaxID=3151835 RepID=UPI0031FC94D3